MRWTTPDRLWVQQRRPPDPPRAIDITAARRDDVSSSTLVIVDVRRTASDRNRRSPQHRLPALTRHRAVYPAIRPRRAIPQPPAARRRRRHLSPCALRRLRPAHRAAPVYSLARAPTTA